MAESELHAGTGTSYPYATPGRLNGLDWIALVLLIVGGINWGLVGAFDLDLVAMLFGPGSMVSRITYILVGLAAIWGFAIMRLGRGERA
ncbi:DUF378 domain-containing protein [Ramlibacter sp. Leaf400]|uniref:DUF378 domain-containing protein n=1 Tax=Ramlibacter sp. Leaf400 TaxID=1736365 RepID=UPI0006FFCF23|nr:DUF378 domain-containing protein [Ramlibacter sp. Leaf400]KQT13035.1 hypothetical protein ASG30_21705 [Ramlibacter sp. Leaf400]